MIMKMHNESEAWFLDDRECAKMIKEAGPKKLVNYFRSEKHGAYRGDICRGAALYLKGGLYFDVDILPRFPVWNVIDKDTEFIVPVSYTSFFQAFVGVIPRHPVMRKYLDLFVDYYENRHEVNDFVGCALMHDAYNMLQPNHTKLLKECNLNDDGVGCDYPDIPRRKEGPSGCCCNFVVADDATQTVPFYSRIQARCN
jgi:hypothetical protein